MLTRISFGQIITVEDDDGVPYCNVSSIDTNQKESL
jgi:hypothetical protein